jgi:hypothetical protein
MLHWPNWSQLVLTRSVQEPPDDVLPPEPDELLAEPPVPEELEAVAPVPEELEAVAPVPEELEAVAPVPEEDGWPVVPPPVVPLFFDPPHEMAIGNAKATQGHHSRSCMLDIRAS